LQTRLRQKGDRQETARIFFDGISRQTPPGERSQAKSLDRQTTKARRPVRPNAYLAFSCETKAGRLGNCPVPRRVEGKRTFTLQALAWTPVFRLWVTRFGGAIVCVRFAVRHGARLLASSLRV